MAIWSGERTLWAFQAGVRGSWGGLGGEESEGKGMDRQNKWKRVSGIPGHRSWYVITIFDSGDVHRIRCQSVDVIIRLRCVLYDR